ncbi:MULTISPECIES: hypothetical protein [Vibrio]|uniref:hypothetical protein n=1 Tax=Vibrio TaxID=662 RepID=UPI001482E3EB|nr:MULTISPECIES: hypothetical protein [Vibrio]MDQ2164987.1 hypothetical protein [Vibrio anguillarum]NNN96391.1 hypothetical protein [Vibrio sp. B4-6]
MKKIINTILISASLLSLPSFAGVSFYVACGNISGNVAEPLTVVRINSVDTSLVSNYSKTVLLKFPNTISEKYHYSIHDRNPFVYDLAKTAYLTGAKVKVCIKPAGQGVDELLGIELFVE